MATLHIAKFRNTPIKNVYIFNSILYYWFTKYFIFVFKSIYLQIKSFHQKYFWSITYKCKWARLDIIISRNLFNWLHVLLAGSFHPPRRQQATNFSPISATMKNKFPKTSVVTKHYSAHQGLTNIFVSPIILLVTM